VAHDVLTQKFRREAEVVGLTWRGRLIARAKSALVRVDETRMLGGLDRVLTFSTKDSEQLNTMIGREIAHVIDPPLEPADARWDDPRQPVGGQVLFVGAFYRPENSDGAMWLIREIWPLVTRQISSARLVLAGVGPDDRMKAAAAADPSIRTTGYVDDLTPYYQNASLAVVPLLAGAGVKFKTITSMLWGVPVVATPIGVEGIGARRDWDRHFFAVTERPEQFAEAIIQALQDPGRSAEVASSARRFAVSRYGAGEFARKLDLEYRPLVVPGID
jgi:glycosyltransferase involved in cell wall biosynthesis